ncbi:minichromosome maintenance protein 5 [Monosporozyma servazzii]
MSFDSPEVYSAPVLQGQTPNDDDNTQIIKSFTNFLLEFRINSQFLYRDQLRNCILIKRFALYIELEHLIAYNEDLYNKLLQDPSDIIPLFEIAITQVAKRMIILNKSSSSSAIDDNNNENDNDPALIPNFQLMFNSNANQIALRDLNSSHVAKIIRISGIIISTSILSSRATHLQIMCRNCRHTTSININNFNSIGSNNISLPHSCLSNKSNIDSSINTDTTAATKNCGPDPYLIIHESSQFIDQQFLKLQEIPESVPVGEMPRNITMSCDRYLTNNVVPGTRVTIVGIYSIYNSKKIGGGGASDSNGGVAIRTPYIKILGIQKDIDINTSSNNLNMFSEDEEEEFLTMARRDDIYQLLTKSIAPSIFGNEDIKMAIVCLLMGGSKKILPDGMRLRGDINVLLLGDPGTAKSQLLKFVEKVSPIAVYTSGKGSSAAGLTASVQRDPMTREFFLEGGAMVLADGGVVCIDEFDKMRDEDRVAIHEAMEQQTISIAKAGITTVLNSRTSVLAAANPIYGRYDESKSPGDNIDFQTTILSRFDMIFIVKDEHNEERDISIANHVINIHTGRTSQDQQDQENNGTEIPMNKLKRFIQYCRMKCAPRLSPQAATKLSSQFVTIRKQLMVNEIESNERSTIPITVRQLEAIIRITESLAKLELSPIAHERHVDEAIRLFQASTMDAASQDSTAAGNSNNNGGNLMANIRLIETELKRRLPIGWSTSYQTLRREFVDSGKYSQNALDKALYILEKHDTIQLRHQGQNIYRSGI